MSDKPSSAAGGALIAFGALAGFIIGYIYREPSAGLVIGLALGGASAVAIWLTNRR